MYFLIAIGISSCQPSRVPDAVNESSSVSKTEIEASVTDEQIVAFCGGCHAMPVPTSFPKNAWYDEVKRGFEFYHQSKRKDLTAPRLQPVVDYFRTRAPESLEPPQQRLSPSPVPVHFRTTQVAFPRAGKSTPKPGAISYVGHLRNADGFATDLLFSDMANGGIFIEALRGAASRTRRLAKLDNPAACSSCDLNGNGKTDLVVADLGSFNPNDHDRGRVVWIADIHDEQPARLAVTVFEHLGRVADVQSADFDGDGDLDLVVAEFGWHQTGRILWLENQGTKQSPNFVEHVVDPRPGAIHVPVVDLNGDGKPDFIALLSQEFEVIEAFFNQGDGTFLRQTLHAAGDPAFGSSGIQVIDLDQDGDYDILYTNGDMFDSFLIKPYHGIQWLENTGQAPYVPHRLSSLPGVHRALAGDVDGDGDLDIVASAFLPATVRETATMKDQDSLILLERSSTGEYLRHSLESGNCIHASLDLADLDGDGDLDIAVGSFRDKGSADDSVVTIWWNENQR